MQLAGALAFSMPKLYPERTDNRENSKNKL